MKRRTLKLSKQTIRQLTPAETEQIRGGKFVPIDFWTFTQWQYGCHTQIACTLTCVTMCVSCAPGC